MKYVLYPQHDDCLAIVTPAYENQIDAVIDNDIPSNTPYKIVESLNTDNAFFNAYEFDQEVGAKINISKAKEIWLNHYRTARTPLLTALDVSFMRAVESGNTDLQKEIASKKQALRDVTKTELPNTLEEIKNTWPEILGQNPFNR
jgi:hypothetical protein